MKKFAVAEGEISVSPLAFESFGVRGMGTFVETDDVSILIDPGSSLGPRFNLSPHRLEYIALAASKKRLVQAAKRADVITISHYHFDHYTPFFHEWRWLWSSPEIAEKIYKGRVLLAKDITENINPVQRKRGFFFWKKVSEIAEVKPADGRTFRFGETVLRFSRPIPHGPEKGGQSNVLMLTVRTKGAHLVHASDVQGPASVETARALLRERPNVAIIGGPPLYLLGFKTSREELEQAQANLCVISKKVENVVVDHHLLRSADYHEFLEPVIRVADKAGHRVCTAAELVGEKPHLLEVRRRELHQREPVSKEWYKKLEEGRMWEDLL